MLYAVITYFNYTDDQCPSHAVLGQGLTQLKWGKCACFLHLHWNCLTIFPVPASLSRSQVSPEGKSDVWCYTPSQIEWWWIFLACPVIKCIIFMVIRLVKFKYLDAATSMELWPNNGVIKWSTCVTIIKTWWTDAVIIMHKCIKWGHAIHQNAPIKDVGVRVVRRYSIEIWCHCATPGGTPQF